MVSARPGGSPCQTQVAMGASTDRRVRQSTSTPASRSETVTWMILRRCQNFGSTNVARAPTAPTPEVESATSNAAAIRANSLSGINSWEPTMSGYSFAMRKPLCGRTPQLSSGGRAESLETPRNQRRGRRLLQRLDRRDPTFTSPRTLRTRARRPAKHSDPMPREESHPDGRRHQLPSLLVQLFEGLLKLEHLLVYTADQAGTLSRSVGPTGRVLPESERVHDFSFDPIGEGLVLPLGHRKRSFSLD